MSEVRVMHSRVVPAHDAPAAGLRPALDDPATRATFQRARRRSRVALKVAVIAAVSAVVATWLAAASAAREVAGARDVANSLVVVDVVLGLALLVVAGTQPLRARDVRRVRHALSSPWSRVEVVTLAGAPADSGRRVVLVLDPVTGQPATSWLIEMVRTPRWIEVDERQWAYLSAGRDESTAVLAPLDRSSFAILRARVVVGSASVHEWAWNHAREHLQFDRPAEAGPPLAASAAGAGVHVEADQARRWPNRPLTTRGQVGVVAALALVASIVTLATAAAQRGDDARAAWLLREGGRVSAVVVSSHGNGRNSSQIEVEYGTGDGWTYRVRRSVIESQRPARGATVEVAFDPANPVDIAIVGIDEPRRDQVAFVLWAAFLFVTGRFAWRALRRGRAREPTLTTPP